MRFVNVLSTPSSTPVNPPRPSLLPHFDAARCLYAPAADGAPLGLFLVGVTTILKHSLRRVALAAFSRSHRNRHRPTIPSESKKRTQKMTCLPLSLTRRPRASEPDEMYSPSLSLSNGCVGSVHTPLFAAGRMEMACLADFQFFLLVFPDFLFSLP
ncbi:hypothetical protein MVEN_02339000 [Mycena venus]|uniref:Uncharacterized protein n=1 Tax=Mycena venus TaxID=2733690 RepID=A0A8H7CET5_9AGAR|nr:hypothetical protein MVEN_02339000 [Mycena venus]